MFDQSGWKPDGRGAPLCDGARVEYQLSTTTTISKVCPRRRRDYRTGVFSTIAPNRRRQLAVSMFDVECNPCKWRDTD
jgi:hypothetical protein